MFYGCFLVSLIKFYYYYYHQRDCICQSVNLVLASHCFQSQKSDQNTHKQPKKVTTRLRNQASFPLSVLNFCPEVVGQTSPNCVCVSVCEHLL